MSKLIQLRQRIRAIETIKKVTHAMRLIAMSTHSQLKTLQDPINDYTNQIKTVLNELMRQGTAVHLPILYPEQTVPEKTLVILIGSQKGLCGSFNTNLFKKFNHAVTARNFKKETVDLIAVGQKAVDYTMILTHATVIGTHPKLTSTNLSSIAQSIAHAILQAHTPYRSVIIIANEFKTFFNQTPKIIDLIPFKATAHTTTALDEGMLWEQTPQEIAAALIPQYIHAQIHFYLFQSLYAEHAARFVSMDGATRNAKTLLEGTKLEYNKLRQAKITKELTELSGSYS